MSIEQFNYSIVNDTWNGIIDFTRIRHDYETLGLNEELLAIKVNGDILCFEFQGPLNDPTLTDQTLDAFVAAHMGEPLPRIALYDLVDEALEDQCFRDIDYTITPIPNLYPQRTFVQGELQKVMWYADSSLQVAILEVVIDYARDIFGFVVSRQTTRSWFHTDGTKNEHHKKVTQKVYSPLEQIKEGKIRRGNIVDGVQLPTMSFMVETMTVEPWNLSQNEILLMARDFLDRHGEIFQCFIESSSSVTDPADPNFGKKRIVVSLEEAAVSTDTWLKNTPASIGGQISIEQYLVGEFSI